MVSEAGSIVPEGMVDFGKIRGISKAIQTCIHAQDVLYPLEPILPLVDYFLHDLEAWGESYAYKVSLDREPREEKKK